MSGALLATLTRLPYFNDVLELDVSTYLTLGSQWAHGVLPYRDLFDNKGPLMPELYLGLSLPRSVVFVRVVLLLSFILLLVSLSSLIERHAGRRAAWLWSRSMPWQPRVHCSKGRIPTPSSSRWRC